MERRADRRRRTSSSSAPRIAGQGRRAARRTPRATSAASTRAPASACGSSTPFRSPASSATTPGEKTRGQYTGNTGVWTQITVDEELGIAYLPIEMSTGDYYGGHRPATTCSPKAWSPSTCRPASATGTFQLVHHDLGLRPSLRADPGRHHGRRQAHQGDRAADQAGLHLRVRSQDGEPVWPIEERPVEKGTVPGEWYSPTQPFFPPSRRRSSAGRSPKGPDRLHAGAEGRRR